MSQSLNNYIIHMNDLNDFVNGNSWLNKLPGIEFKGYVYLVGEKIPRIVYQNKIIVPVELRLKLVEHIYNHNRALPSRDGMFKYIYGKYWGVTRSFIMDFLRSKPEWAQRVPVRRSAIQSIVFDRPGHLQIDLIDKNRSKIPELKSIRFILVCVDIFSHYAWAFVIPNKQSKVITQYIEKIYDELLKHGMRIQSIQSDNGKEFTGDLDKFCIQYAIKRYRSQPYTPQTQGLVERFNRSLLNWIKNEILKDQGKSKEYYIKLIEKFTNSYNNTPNPNFDDNKPIDLLYNHKFYIRKNIKIPVKKNIKIGDRVVIPLHIDQNKIKSSLKKYTDYSLLVEDIIPAKLYNAESLILRDPVKNTRVFVPSVKCVKVNY